MPSSSSSIPIVRGGGGDSSSRESKSLHEMILPPPSPMRSLSSTSHEEIIVQYCHSSRESKSLHEMILPPPSPVRSLSSTSVRSLSSTSHEEIIVQYGHSSRPPSREAMKLPKEEINAEGFHFAISSKRGSRKRKLMEDAHKAMNFNILLPAEASNSNSRKVEASFFGVFDGHGGWKAAEFAAENIGHYILDGLFQAMEEQLKLAGESDNHHMVNKADLLNKKNLEKAVRTGYLRTHEEFLKQRRFGGSTCVTALIVDGNLVVSNAGDSRAVISRRSRNGDGGEAQALTRDHKPGREDERKRIEKLGGSVSDHSGISRVGPMAVSRAIGDGFMKKLMSAEPETTVVEILSDCEFIILASDGLWDVVSNQEAVDIARPLEHGGLLGACKKLVEVAVARKSKDDISVMIVQLEDFYKKRKMP